MIVTRLQGGLGNQLFQYATGLAVARKWDTELGLDVSDFPDVNDRGYQLGDVRVTSEFARAEDIWTLKYGRAPGGILSRLFLRARHPFGLPQAPTWCHEQQPGVFQPTIFNCGPDAYLDGYWQSEKYFRSIGPELREILTPVRISQPARHWLPRMETGIAVHVRRGDYVHTPKTLALHGMCPESYYLAALSYLKERMTFERIFVFSDEPDWVRQHFLPHENLTTVSGQMTAAEDIWLMSHCRANIIANSSFSWWGGWLNGHADKIVVAPLTWFQNPDRSSADIIPQGWVRI